jgi:hypothetical protein
MTDMRCPGCGAEMHLIEVAPDKTKMVPGYEQHTFECSGCHDHVQQLVFIPRAIAYAERHFAVFGELAGIAQKIEQDLLEPHRVGGEGAQVLLRVDDETVLILVGELTAPGTRETASRSEMLKAPPSRGGIQRNANWVSTRAAPKPSDDKSNAFLFLYSMQFVHMKVNVDQLRTFITVVESGRIQRAAARLHMSQPAASRQMRALEAADRITVHKNRRPCFGV